MRRTLLSATALACLSFAASRSAFAQLAVLDGTAAGNAITSLQHEVQQLTTLKSQLTNMESQLTTQQNLFRAAQHGNSALSIAPGLSSLSSQMPGSSSAWVPGMTFGSGLAGQGQQFYNQNHVYTPQGDDFAAQEMERKQRATANMQAEVQAGLQASDDRIAMLGQLQSDIEDGTNTDAVYLAAVQAHIQSEQTFLANEQTKIARMQLAQATQASVDQQRAEQHARQEAEEMHAAAVAAAGW